MRVLGVDPGLTRCGLGVVDGEVGGHLHLVDVRVVRTSPDAAVGDRLVRLEHAIEEWLDLLRPDAVAVERVFSQHNVRTVMGTAQASAVAITCAARRGLPVALAAMVTRVLRLASPPRPVDATDALALAICHVWRGGAAARLAAAAAAARAPASRIPRAARTARASGAAPGTSPGASGGTGGRRVPRAAGQPR